VTDQHRGQRLDRAQIDRVLASSRTVRDVIATLTGNDRLTTRLQKLYRVATSATPACPAWTPPDPCWAATWNGPSRHRPTGFWRSAPS